MSGQGGRNWGMFLKNTSDVDPSFWPPGSGSVSFMRIRIQVSKTESKSWETCIKINKNYLTHRNDMPIQSIISNF